MDRTSSGRPIYLHALGQLPRSLTHVKMIVGLVWRRLSSTPVAPGRLLGSRGADPTIQAWLGMCLIQGVVVATAVMPSCCRMGRLSSEASTQR